MLDAFVRPLIDPPLNRVAHILSRSPLNPDSVTIIGFIIGIVACVTAFMGFYYTALIFILLNRIIDGLDGPIARAQNRQSDFGGYLDIVLDFLIYAGFPLCFAMGIGTSQALTAGIFILFSFIGTGTSFLAYAILCAKRGISTEVQGKKTFYFSNGLMEGTETIIFFILICLFPVSFVAICFIFGSLCLLTTTQRIWTAYRTFQ
tara:strand:+ start:465 stop:1076 length:612 start_codon:yes stop_codon:yes gene_type:complete